MRAVLDASVGMKLGIPEQDSSKAEALIADYIAGVHELLAPDIFPIEIAHGLIRAERRGIISDAPAKLADVMANSPILFSYLPFLGRAVEIAKQARVGVYDCLYVALAEQEKCELITADTSMLNALQAKFPFIRELSSI